MSRLRAPTLSRRTPRVRWSEADSESADSEDVDSAEAPEK